MFDENMSVYDILEELASDNSGNFKLEVLKRHADNEDLKQFFKMTLDKSLNYYLRKIPKYSEQHTGETSLKQAMNSLMLLAKRKISGNRSKFFVSKLLTSCSRGDADVIQRILKRDPNCKVSVATVNKIWSGLIKIWPVMLCERSTEKNLKNIEYPAFIQEKSDGLRFNIIYVDGEIKYRSRNGKHIQLFDIFDEHIKLIAEGVPFKDFVLDGEGLIATGRHIDTPSNEWANIPETELFETRQKGNGIFNKAIQNTIKRDDAELVRVKLWDIIPYDEFMNNTGTTTYKRRVTVLKNVLKNEKINLFGLTMTKIIKNQGQAIRFYKNMLSAGKEGAIIKNLNSVWEDKRSKDQVKLKIVKQLDMRVVDTYEHKKKKKWVGGLTVESEDGKVRVNVGSGLKDKHRKMEPYKFINQIVMVEANGMIQNQDDRDDSWSLFLPIFKEIRIDKDDADSFEEIKEQFDSI